MSKRQRDLGATIHPYDPFGNLEFFQDIGYVILGWFTITVEAFLRYDFGERYYSRGNFFVGLVTIWLFALLMMFVSMISQKPGTLFFLIPLYLLASAYHFWRIWVRNRAGWPQHSLFMGRPLLVPLGRLVMKILNPILQTVTTALASLTMPDNLSKPFKSNIAQEPIFTDADHFTLRFIEPVVIFVLGIIVPGALGWWFLICAVALAVHTGIAFEQEREGQVDLVDSFIETQFLKDDIAQIDRIKRRLAGPVQQIIEQVQQNPDQWQEIKEVHPTVADAMTAFDDFFEENKLPDLEEKSAVSVEAIDELKPEPILVTADTPPESKVSNVSVSEVVPEAPASSQPVDIPAEKQEEEDDLFSRFG